MNSIVKPLRKLQKKMALIEDILIRITRIILFLPALIVFLIIVKTRDISEETNNEKNY